MKKYKKHFLYLVLIFIGIIPAISLFHSGLPITHDGQDHVARIANFYQNLSEGNIIPRWAGNLNWGYGHPILEFLYPFPSYTASFFHFLGFSLVDSVKIVFGLGTILSIIFMYLWLSSFLNKFSALFGAVLYTHAPYRFVEVYVRGDIGEHLAFAFIPLVLFFIYSIYKKKNMNNIFLGGFSLAFLILSHNAISLMLMPFIIFYGFFLLNLSKNRKSYIINLTSLMLIGFGLSAFFWIPGLLEGKYTLRNIVTAGGYIGRFVNFRDLLYGPWSYGISGQFTVQLGILHWASFILSIILLTKFYIKKDRKNLVFSLGLIVYTLIAIFLMLPISSFIWQKFILLQNFQFPWRFLAIPVFTTSVLGAVVFEQVFRKSRIWFTVFAIILLLFLSKDYMRPIDYLYKPENFYTGIYNSTTDTGESSPIWSVRFMEKRALEQIQLIDGKASIELVQRSTTKRIYKINAQKTSRILENTLYFPGWTVLLDSKPAIVEFQDQRFRGLITFYVPEGKHDIEIVYRETKLRLFSNIASTFVLFGILTFYLFKFIKTKF
ncbi:MAG: glycosyltransferase family 39 protein [Candidatus Levybacteria bacterium]|nr:glycosyltransferase family 39 protein [Candidatus Levybacteria bacterium]